MRSNSVRQHWIGHSERGAHNIIQPIKEKKKNKFQCKKCRFNVENGHIYLSIKLNTYSAIFTPSTKK